MTPALAARDLTKVYDSDGAPIRAVDGVNLEIGTGEFVAVMGPSGCGKSTLLHLLGALDTSTSGEVFVDGAPLSGMDDAGLTDIRRHRIGFVFQFFNLVPVLTAAENVGLPAVIDGQPADDRDARVGELLASLGLDSVAGKLPSQLSGGQQQRVAIARALVNRPAAVLADEPTGNLDRRSGLDVMELFRELHRGGETLVVVTHDPNVAAFAERVVFLRDGRVFDDVRISDQEGAAALLTRMIDE